MHSFLSSITNKAQSAINSSSLSKDKHPTVNAIQHQIRAFGQQYTSATPVQKIITAEKSLSLDYESISRNSQYHSKELYTWGQNESEDLKDVTDRLAYLNFIQGSLSKDLALKLDTARGPLKTLRDAESAITPRRNIRAGLKLELSRLEHSQQKGMERKFAELKEQIKKAELDDEPQEKEIEILKRKAVRESEQIKWDAFREYAEKLLLVTQASSIITSALPPTPPSETRAYTGDQATTAARASLQHALDNYKPGDTHLPLQLTEADLHRSDTRSFGESHASELSSINGDPSSASRHDVPTTPPASQHPQLPSQSSAGSPGSTPPAQSPLTAVASAAPESRSQSQDSDHASTAPPISAQTDEHSKPASESASGNPPPPADSQQSSSPKFESAEEEKERLRREEEQNLSKTDYTSSGKDQSNNGDSPPQYQEL